MFKARLYTVARAALLLSLCSVLSACLGSGAKNSVRYYLVDPVVADMSLMDMERPLAIEIIDLDIPQYLQRFQMVTRDGDNRLRLSDNNQWGENLRKNLLRTLGLNLGSRLGTIDIGTPLDRSASLPDYRIHVSISQFEVDRDGRVRLSARWQVSDVEEEELGTYSNDLQADERVSEGDYDQIVADMQSLFAGLCDQIAASIMALEAAN